MDGPHGITSQFIPLSAVLAAFEQFHLTSLRLIVTVKSPIKQQRPVTATTTSTVVFTHSPLAGTNPSAHASPNVTLPPQESPSSMSASLRPRARWSKPNGPLELTASLRKGKEEMNDDDDGNDGVIVYSNVAERVASLEATVARLVQSVAEMKVGLKGGELKSAWGLIDEWMDGWMDGPQEGKDEKFRSLEKLVIEQQMAFNSQLMAIVNTVERLRSAVMSDAKRASPVKSPPHLRVDEEADAGEWTALSSKSSGVVLPSPFPMARNISSSKTNESSEELHQLERGNKRSSDILLIPAVDIAESWRHKIDVARLRRLAGFDKWDVVAAFRNFRECAKDGILVSISS
jgi:hypothetical protein